MDTAGVRELRLVQINTWGGKLKFQLIPFLAKKDADIICMQEVMEYEGHGGAFLGMLNEIVAGTGHPYQSFASTLSFSYMGQEVDFGNAVLSKLPIKSESVIFTKGKYFRNYNILKDDYNVRNLQVVRFEINGKPLTVMNHHGQHVPGTKQGDAETMRQMKIIASEVQSTKGPLILTGDFNLSPDSPSLAVINDLLENLSISHDLKRTYTKLSNVNEVCDYIFVNQAIKVSKFTLSEEIVSDHKALIFDFDL